MDNAEIVNALKEIAVYLNEIGWILIFGFIVIIIFCSKD